MLTDWPQSFPSLADRVYSSRWRSPAERGSLSLVRRPGSSSGPLAASPPLPLALKHTKFIQIVSY